MNALLLVALAAVSTQTWTNPACKSGPCTLKSASISLRPTVVENAYGKEMSARMEASSVAELRNLVMVQFVRGCSYTILPNGDRRMGTTEHYFAKRVQPYQHKGWDLDVGSNRPGYWTDSRSGTRDELRGLDIPMNANYTTTDPFAAGAQPWLGDATKLKKPELYIFDDPTPSQLEGGSIATTSLQFQVCVYDTRTIPAVAASPTVGPEQLGKPLHCFAWQSNYGYNSALLEFEERQDIDPYCLN